MFLELTFGDRFGVTSRAAVVVLAVDASEVADARPPLGIRCGRQLALPKIR
jgi:hypothetical protein